MYFYYPYVLDKEIEAHELSWEESFCAVVKLPRVYPHTACLIYWAPATWHLIQFSESVHPGRQQVMAGVPGSMSPNWWTGLSFKLLPSAWPSPRFYGYWEWTSGDGRAFSPSHPLPLFLFRLLLLSFSFYDYFSAFQIKSK